MEKLRISRKLRFGGKDFSEHSPKQTANAFVANIRVFLLHLYFFSPEQACNGTNVMLKGSNNLVVFDGVVSHVHKMFPNVTNSGTANDVTRAD